MSSRQLFTKIYQAKPQHAEHAANELIHTLISNSHRTLQDKRLTKINTHTLQKQVVSGEVEKMRQAYAPDPT